jgi:branched-chain amino acid transport system ATP-binding protein
MTDPMLKLEALRAGYGPTTVLDGLSLTVAPGERVAMVGRNGVGKTTTLRTIMGLVPLVGGRIEFLGEDISRLNPHQRAQRGLGYVPQTRDIFPSLTVEENLLAGLKRRPRGAVDEAYALFPRLAERRRNRGTQLSGGEQQMLAVARALVTDPRVILLDEPSQGLAPLVVEELTRLITRLRDEGVSLLLVEQNLNLAEAVADVVYVMVKGQMVYHAPLERFRAEREEVKTRYLTL